MKTKTIQDPAALVRRNYLFIGLGLLLLLFAVYVPLSPEILNVRGIELTGAGRVSLGVLLFALVMWISEAIPFHITGLLAVALLALLKVDNFTQIVSVGFGNQIVVFFIGVLILSAFVTHSGMGRRISVFLLSKTGNSTSLILLGFLTLGALLAMWITEMAVAAMLMPLAVAILKEEGLEPMKSNFGKGLLITCAWGPGIGGIGTPAGAGGNPIAIGFLKDMAGIELSFIDWMKFGVPSALLLIIPAWLVLKLFFKPEITHLSKTKEQLEADFRALAPMDRQEKMTVGLFVLTIILWLTTPFFEGILGLPIPISLPVLLTSSIFFFPGVSKISWKQIQSEISWSGILLIVTGISLGMMVYQSGAANWLSILLLGGIGNLGLYLQIFSVVLLVSLLKVAFSSNTVTATIVIPIMIALSQNLGLDPLSVTIPAGLTSGMAFILVTSTPTNIIPYSAGYFSIKDLAKAGTALTLVSSLVLALVIKLILPISGIS